MIQPVLVKAYRLKKHSAESSKKVIKKDGHTMIKTTLKIDGMMCGMCESHINEVIRKNFDVKKVSASASKGEAVIISENPIDANWAKRVIKDTGYDVLDSSSEPYEKKGLFGGLFSR